MKPVLNYPVSLTHSRDEVKTKWSVSDFIKAFIKFHGHVYLCKSLDKLNTLREKLEEQFQVSPKPPAVALHVIFPH